MTNTTIRIIKVTDRELAILASSVRHVYKLGGTKEHASIEITSSDYDDLLAKLIQSSPKSQIDPSTLALLTGCSEKMQGKGGGAA